MKKIFFPVIAAVMMACNSNAANNPIDSEGNASAESSEAPATAEPQKKFLSPDLAMLNLCGQVKKVTIEKTQCNDYGEPLEGYDSEEEEIIEFDKNGKIISGSIYGLDISLEETEINRDSKGRIIKIVQGNTTYEYTWEGNRLYTIDTYWEGELTGASTEALAYNADGTLVVKFDESVGDGVESNSRIKWSQSEFDDKGNWTVAYQNYLFCDQEGDGEEGKEFSNQYLQYKVKRTIEYYK